MSKKADNNDSMTRAVGRRKTASARVRITPGKGSITVNDKDFKDYFSYIIWQNEVTEPLRVVSKEKDFDVSVKVAGGGLHGQAVAVQHGIARALVKWNEDLKPLLKAEGLLTRDSRAKERKKAGLRKARRGHQWKKR